MKKLWPYFFLTAVVLLIGIVNFKAGTYLTGWDNLQVELNPFINLQRAIFTAWQEYQGTGLAGGMGHGADLIRQLFLFLLYPVIPLNQVRYVWTILTLLIGTVGMFVLIKHLLNNEKAHGDTISSLGALFYLLNLATLQSYYTPFEVFTSQFASLPWLLLTTYLYLKTPTRKTLFSFAIVLLLSTPTGYVPTVFVVYLMAAILMALVLRNPFSSHMLANTKHILMTFLIIFAVNAFWLLPFSYFTLTSSGVNVNAKINQMSTENIFAMNKEYGTIPDVILLKGFWFQATEPTRSGTYQYVLALWQNHLGNPFITAVGFLFFAIILLGVIHTISSKHKPLISFVVLFFFSITMLLTATPPFSWIDLLLRDYVPLFGQVFRFPFTKFSLLAATLYAVFFAFGIALVIQKLQKVHYQFIHLIVSTITVVLLTIFMLPIFQGNLFYTREQIAIPQSYMQLFDFFKRQDQNSRIANFPQPSFWGWDYYTWDYSGSGFLWYGIKQPILDRAFDVWSPYSENYYFEVSQAIYSQNPQLLAAVLQKYQITWLLVDKNLLNPSSPKALFVPEFEKLLTQIPSVKIVQTFGNIKVYKVSLQDKPKSFVFTTPPLPTITSYNWSNQDNAYAIFGNYQSNPKMQSDYTFPFQSLFSLKTSNEKAFTLSEEKQTITFAKTFTLDQSTTLLIPSLAKTEKVLPVTVATQVVGNNTTISLLYQAPIVSVDTKTLWEGVRLETLFTIPSALLEQGANLNINGITNYGVSTQTKTLGTTMLSTTQDNALTLTTTTGQTQTAIIPPKYLAAFPFMQEHSLAIQQGTHILRITIPKVTDKSLSYTMDVKKAQEQVRKCDLFRPGTIRTSLYDSNNKQGILITSKNATACLSLYAPNLSHTYGYALFTQSENITGRPLHIWIENIDQHYVPLDTYLSAKGGIVTDASVLAPQDPFGNYYSMHMESVSIASDESKNALFQTAMYPIPYTFLTGIVAGNETTPPIAIGSSADLSVTHPNESLYIVSGVKANETLVLSQAYNPGWAAYATSNNALSPLFPFFFGTKLNNHVLVNNWENGWLVSDQEISNGQNVIIIYLPQYLQYFGFLLLLVTVASTAFIYVSSNRVKNEAK